MQNLSYVNNVQIKASGISDTGKKKSNNEDHYSIIYPEFPGFPHILAVSDGVGGRKAGELASAVALQYIIGYLMPRSFHTNFNQEEILSAFQSANKQLRNTSNSDSNFRGMGTTVVLAMIYPDVTYIASIGDSRAYTMNSSIVQVTEDHTLPKELLKRGAITPKQYKEHPYKHHLTRAMGIDEFANPDVFKLNTADFTHILLCTDGLTEHVSDSEIYAMVSKSQSPEASAKKLMQATLQRGASDNVTIVVASVTL